MTRHATISDLVWPLDNADADLPVAWARGVVVQVLTWVWRGYDRLYTKLVCVDFTQPLEQLERNLTELHFYEIQALWVSDGGFSSMQPGHEMHELLSRDTAAAMPPAYDLGFVHRENPHWKLPIEAKVLRGPASITGYLEDVQKKFVAGIAAPIVGEGGMIGYLIRGDEKVIFAKLANALQQDPATFVAFADRWHRTTTHVRGRAPEIRIHHMVMRFDRDLDADPPSNAEQS